MRVAVYIDGYNLYHGGRHQLGKARGWKWLDLRSLLTGLVDDQRTSTDPTIARIVYCTAQIDAGLNPDGHRDQGVYLNALSDTHSVDRIEYGEYVIGVKTRPLAVEGEGRRQRPVLVTSQWPVMIQSTLGKEVPDAHFIVSVLHQEEKATDVNVATHMLVDILEDHVDAVVAISNDSDLRLPVQFARSRVPVGHVNPRGARFAGHLAGKQDEGVGNH